MCMQANNERNRAIHEALVKHLKNSASCTRCGNSCGCVRLKQTLDTLGEKAFLEKAIAGELPMLVQELYNQKFSAMFEKSNP